MRGNQPAGPNRWRRAAQWAKERPNTAMAKKYLARLEAAEKVAAAGKDRAWLHWDLGPGGKPKYNGQTCSTVCAMLHLQLQLGIAGLEDLKDRAERDTPLSWVTERPADSPRKGKCPVCGGQPGVI